MEFLRLRHTGESPIALIPMAASNKGFTPVCIDGYLHMSMSCWLMGLRGLITTPDTSIHWQWIDILPLVNIMLEDLLEPFSRLK